MRTALKPGDLVLATGHVCELDGTPITLLSQWCRAIVIVGPRKLSWMSAYSAYSACSEGMYVGVLANGTFGYVWTTNVMRQST